MKFKNITEETDILGRKIFKKVKMTINNKQALVEGFKQFVRSVIFLLLAWLLSGSVISWIIDITTGTRLDEMTKVQLTGAVTLIIQYIDKAIHESDLQMNGLLPQTPLT